MLAGSRLRWPILVGLLTLTLIATGCAVKPTPGATTPVASAGASLTPSAKLVTPGDLRGTYTADVEGTTASSGVWTLTITATDVLITNPGDTTPFSVDPTDLSESTLMVAASQDCPDQSSITGGEYSVSLQGATLTFKAVRDSCGDRKAVLSTVPWTRKG
jgi:hypothetical protein